MSFAYPIYLPVIVFSSIWTATQFAFYFWCIHVCVCAISWYFIFSFRYKAIHFIKDAFRYYFGEYTLDIILIKFTLISLQMEKYLLNIFSGKEHRQYIFHLSEYTLAIFFLIAHFVFCEIDTASSCARPPRIVIIISSVILAVSIFSFSNSTVIPWAFSSLRFLRQSFVFLANRLMDLV